MYHDRRAEHGESGLRAREYVRELLGVHQATLQNWIERVAPVDAGLGSKTVTDQEAELRALRRKASELRQANEVLKTASAFFAAAEVDRRLRRSSTTSTNIVICSGSTRSVP